MSTEPRMRLLLEGYASRKEKLGESHMQIRLAAARIEKFTNRAI